MQEPDEILRKFRKFILKHVFYHGELENDAVFKAGAEKQPYPRKQSPHAVDHALEAFALFPKEICKEPRFQQCVDEAGAANNLLVFQANFIRFLCQHCFSSARQ